MTRRPFRVVLTLFVSSLAACASSAGRSPDAACTSDLRPSGEPLADVLDSTALARELTSIWGSSAGLTLAIVAYDSVGALDSTRVVSVSATSVEKDRLGAAISRHVDPTAGPRERVRLVIGDETGLALRRVAEFQGCPPELRNLDIVVREMQREGERLTVQNRTRVQLLALVGDDGLVHEIRVDEGSSNLEVDAAATRVMRTAIFSPARMEGIPVGVWVTFPVTFRAGPGGDDPNSPG